MAAPPTQTIERWNQRKPLTPADSVSGDLVDFPVLISIQGDSDLVAARDDGADFRVTAADGQTQLAIELEDIDRTNGDLILWVKVPLLAQDDPTELFLYFDNPDATGSSDSRAVFSNDYAGVWHLNENATSTGTQRLYADATGNNDGDDLVSTDTAMSPIGRAAQFDGVNDRVEVPHGGGAWALGGGGLSNTGSDMTISAWISTTGNTIDFSTGRANAEMLLPLTGAIDEVRVSTVERDSDWIEASFANQSAPAQFVEVGNAEAL